MEHMVISRKMPRYLVGLGVLGLGVVIVVAVSIGMRLRSAAASTPPIVVKMIDTPATYEPAVVTIKVGETVEWKNVGNSVHHASSDPSTAVNPAEVSNPPGVKPFDSDERPLRGTGFWRRIIPPGLISPNPLGD